MPGAVEFAHTFHTNCRSAGAFNLSAHFVEQLGQIGDFRFARAILHDSFAIGERGCHQQVFGAGDGNFVEDDFRAAQRFCAGFHVAVILSDDRAQPLQSLDVKIDGARSNSAAAR